MKAIPYILVGLIRKILHTCGFPAAAAIASSHKEQRASSFNTYYVPTYLGREVLAGCGAENVAKFGGHHQHMSPRIQKREYTTPPPFSLEWMNESKKCQARCVLWRQTKFFFLLQCISMTPLLFDTHKNSDEIYYEGRHRQLGLKSGGVQRGWAEISNLWGGFGSPKNILWETDFCA